MDVHRSASLDMARTAPLAGSSCFFHEAFMKWNELNCGADFSAYYSEVNQFCQSLPQLVLHQKVILDKLLARLTFEARPGHSFPDSLLTVYRCTRSHSPPPPPWPGHSFPFQLNLTDCSLVYL